MPVHLSITSFRDRRKNKRFEIRIKLKTIVRSSACKIKIL